MPRIFVIEADTILWDNDPLMKFISTQICRLINMEVFRAFEEDVYDFVTKLHAWRERTRGRTIDTYMSTAEISFAYLLGRYDVTLTDQLEYLWEKTCDIIAERVLLPGFINIDVVEAIAGNPIHEYHIILYGQRDLQEHRYAQLGSDIKRLFKIEYFAFRPSREKVKDYIEGSIYVGSEGAKEAASIASECIATKEELIERLRI